MASAHDVVQIRYQDLKEQFEERGEEDNNEGPEMNQDLVNALGTAFGPDGLGLLEVTDIPDEMVELRTKVLLLSKKVAELSPQELEEITLPEKFFSIGWSHGKEQFRGRYDLAKGSFYLDPFREANVFPSALQPELEASLMEMTHFMAVSGTIELTFTCLSSNEQNSAFLTRLPTCHFSEGWSLGHETVRHLRSTAGYSFGSISALYARIVRECQSSSTSLFSKAK